MKPMRSILLVLVGAAGVASALLQPYAQCGGLYWTKVWQCVEGHSCTSVTGTSDFFCLPNVGPIITHALPYGQCGGINFIGPTICTPGWNCLKANDFFFLCTADPGYIIPPTMTPDLAGPGAFCGESRTPAVCVPGYTCSVGAYNNYITCNLDRPPTPTTTTTTTKAVLTTTLKSITTKSATTWKTTTTSSSRTTTRKTTTTAKMTTTTTLKLSATTRVP